MYAFAILTCELVRVGNDSAGWANNMNTCDKSVGLIKSKIQVKVLLNIYESEYSVVQLT